MRPEDIIYDEWYWSKSRQELVFVFSRHEVPNSYTCCNNDRLYFTLDVEDLEEIV